MLADRSQHEALEAAQSAGADDQEGSALAGFDDHGGGLSALDLQGHLDVGESCDEVAG